MRKGTTPLHTFVLPFDTDIIASVRIVYAQGGDIILTKTGDDVTMDGNKIETRLTQAETLLFLCDAYIDVQVRVLTLDGEALASDIVRVFACRCLDSEVLV